jgi:predicted RND superfamily exporter protein
LEAYTETLPEVGGTHSLAGWIKRAHQKMHDEDPTYYAIPDDVSETQYYLDVLSEPTSPMSHLLLEIVEPTYTKTNVIVRMRSSQFVHQEPVVLALQAYLDEHFQQGPLRATLAGRVNLDYHWLRMVGRSHIRSVCFTSLCVFLLTAVMFRSWLGGFLCTLTVGVAVLVNYAIMGIGDISLGVGTTMFASIAIGGGVDFPIHVLHRLQTGFRENGGGAEEVFRDTFTFTGRALFFTVMVVTVGFMLLCVSEFRTLVRFGLLIGTGMVISFLASITLLPAVLAALKPRFIWGCGTPDQPDRNPETAEEHCS